MLPQMTSATYTNFTLPGGRKVKLRHFVGSEEKALLAAKLSDDIEQKHQAALSVINGCLGDSADIQDMNQTELDALFIHVYNLSVAEPIPLSLKCSSEKCDETIMVNLDTSLIKFGEAPAGKIEIGKTDDGKMVTVIMQAPSLQAIESAESTDEFQDTSTIMVAIKEMYIGEDLFDLSDVKPSEFNEWLMNIQGAYMKCLAFLRSIPRAEFNRDWECPSCKHKNKTVVRGFASFFRS